MFAVEGRQIGSGAPCFIIAEAGVNHNGDLGTAIKLVDSAVEAGADAVKFQTFKAEELVTPRAKKADYQKSTGEGKQIEMLKKLQLSKEEFLAVAAHARKKGIIFLSTPFDFESADMLEEIGVEAFKVASADMVHFPLLEHIAKKGKPVILSSGMAALEEVDESVSFLNRWLPGKIALLHCVSNYPARFEDVNLKVIPSLKARYGIPIGLSDHTLGIEVPIAAAAIGAEIIEKHFTLDKTMEGPDHRASLEPGELKAMITSIRNVEMALGDGKKRPVEREMKEINLGRRSMVASRTIPAGAVITEKDLAFKRPGGEGIPLKEWKTVLGKRTRREISADEPITWELLEVEERKNE